MAKAKLEKEYDKVKKAFMNLVQNMVIKGIK